MRTKLVPIVLTAFFMSATPPVADGYGDTVAAQDPVKVGEQQPPKLVDPRDTDFPRIKGEITAARALRLIYGNYDTETKTAGWFADLAEMRLIMNITRKDQRVLHSKPTVFPVVAISERYVAVPGHARYLLLTSPTWPYGFGCHACEPPVGAAIFEPTESGWQLSWSRKIIDYIGDNGEPLGDIEPVRIGPDKMGFLLHPSFSSMGYGKGGLVIIGEAQNELRELLALWPTEADNEGQCSPQEPDDCYYYRYDSALTFTPGNNPEYFDIRRLTTGTYSDDSLHEPARQVSATARYVFRDGRYRPAP